MIEQEIEAIFKKAGIPLSQKSVKQFSSYREALISWNDKASLISKNDEGRIVERHFVESAGLSLFDEFYGRRTVLDLGTGGGFPGIPLKIVCPDLKLGLLESKQKKCMFLREVTQKLKIEAEVFCARAEDQSLKEKLSTKYDIVVSRAVSQLVLLYDWARPYLKPSGDLIAIKGSRVFEEVEALTSKHPVSVTLQDFPITLAHSENLKVVFVKTKK